MNTLGLLLAFKQVEERVTGDRLDDDTLFTCLLVLLSFLYLFLGWVLAFLPVNSCANNLYSLVSVVVGNSLEGESLVCEEVVGGESHGHSQLRYGDFALSAVQRDHLVKDGSILFCDSRLKHGVVLDGLCPKVGDAGGSL